MIMRNELFLELNSGGNIKLSHIYTRISGSTVVWSAHQTRFLDAHTGQARDRRPLLAIIGGTQTGKSLLAASVLGRLATHYSLPGFLETAVEDDGHFDMADFRVDQHATYLKRYASLPSLRAKSLQREMHS